MEVLVDAFNRVGSYAGSFISSFLALNYHVGDATFFIIKCITSSCTSLLLAVITGIGVALEDLVIFLSEILDLLTASADFVGYTLDTLVARLFSAGLSVRIAAETMTVSIAERVASIHTFSQTIIHNIAVFLNLLGSSCIMLVNLVPSTILIILAGLRSLCTNAGSYSQIFTNKVAEVIGGTPPEFYLGAIIGTMSTVFLTKLTLRTVRERNLSLEMLGSSVLRLVCSVYVLIIRTIARSIGLIFSLLEVTVSNLRVPMFSHAGDSDDEDEDRENLVGEVNDSDDEDRARVAQRKKNYDLLLQRRKNKESRPGGTEDVEDLLMREVEREREDKLCVICVDKEKCIMILPCRHLCVCQECVVMLRAHRNICPICRKEVKQMIKAYL